MAGKGAAGGRPGALVAALALAAAGWAAAGLAEEGTWTASGSAALELRWFPESPAYPGELTGAQAGAVVEPELRWRSADGRHRVELAAFLRGDGRDDERTHADLREAAYRYVGERFELLAGVSRVFWGVAESRHLVDVVNQSDLVEDVDEESKLGQPMVRLAFGAGGGRLELYALPGFRERTFAGPMGRPRPPLTVDAEDPLFGPGAGSGRVDAAARWSRAAGDWDLGLHLFYGTGREPSLVPDADGDRLRPLYRVIRQAGVDVQYTRGAWLAKLEAILRRGEGRGFGAAVAGIERTFYQVGGTAADLGLLLELLVDDRDATAAPTIYDDDVFVGARLAANDVDDTSLLAGAVVDRGDGSIFGLIEASRRLGQRVTLEGQARIFASAGGRSDLAFFARDSYLDLSLAWHW